MTVKRCGAAVAIAAIWGMASGAVAEESKSWMPENFSASVTVTSDYVFRGISQSFEDPAYQFTGEWTPDGGPIYIGTFISSIDFRNTANGNRLAPLELDLLAGVRGEWNIMKWDFGAIGYIYPGMTHNNPALNTNYNYMEVAAKTSWDVLKLFTVVANVNVSPKFQADAGLGVYAETGVDATLPFDINVSARIGRQWIGNNANFGVPDYWTWSVGISRDFFDHITLGAAYYDTDIGKSGCVGGLNICEARGVGYVTFKF